MRSYRYIIDEAHDQMRVQDYLKQVHGYSRRNLVKLKQLETGLMLNGAHTRTVDVLHSGDTLCITFPDDNKAPLAVSSVRPKIAYEDEDVIVLVKPPFMPVHESLRHREDTLANGFAAICADRGEVLRFRPQGRLDRDTSGLVLSAKNAHYASILWKSVSKEYCAIVCGILKQDYYRIEVPIARKEDSLIERMVSEDGQYALTHCFVVARGNGYTLCRFRIDTGRTHQIRVHMAYIGHPLAGDTLYGTDQTLINRHALHCCVLRFPALEGGKTIEVRAPLPEDFLSLMQHSQIIPPQDWLTAPLVIPNSQACTTMDFSDASFSE